MAEQVEGAELAALLGQTGETLTIKTIVVRIAPLVLSQIAEVFKCIDRLAEKGVIEVKGKDGFFGTDFQPMKLVLRGGEDFIEILSIACGQPVEWVGSLNALETARLAGKVWGINKDFFDQNREALTEALGPAIEDVLGLFKKVLDIAVGKLTGLIARVGLGASSGSSAPDTSSKQSKGTRSRR